MKNNLIKSSKMMLAGMCLTGIVLAINGALFLGGVEVEGQTFYVLVLAIVFLLNLLGYINAREINDTSRRLK